MYTLETKTERISFDEKGRVCSFRVLQAPEQEMIQKTEAPAFELQYLEGNDIYQMDAGDAEETEVFAGEGRLTFVFRRIGHRKLDFTAEAFLEKDTLKLTFSLENPEKLQVCQIRYPMLIFRYDLGGRPGSETILRPYNAGQLIEAPSPEALEPDSPFAWMFRPENTNTGHYPGQTFAQFLAYYNDRAGVYAACDDTRGNIKVIKPVHRGGVRLGFQHAADWSRNKKLPYSVILRGFTGDCYDAADIYREWSSRQFWAKPLAERKEIPDWLLDSPLSVVFRMQGQIDEGPAEENRCFLPYEKNIPMLREISETLETPVLPLMMAWEKHGPWVYPDSLPMAGGQDSMKNFCLEAEKEGWHVGTYCNGTRWVTGHYWSGYDGRRFLEEEKGRESFCRTCRQEEWKENWDSGWRESYACCIGSKKTRRIAGEFYRDLLDHGMTCIQFLDQNVGCASFPCYSREHGHPPMPDIWMTEEMKGLLAEFREAAGEKDVQTASALEQPCCEYFIPDIHICDVRPVPPGYPDWKKKFFPLYPYLYHEYILLQGTFGSGQDPFQMEIKCAWNFVLGNLNGGVLDDRGEFVSTDSRWPWGLWKERMGSQESIRELLKNTQAMRRGSGKPYLVYGRMERPARIGDIPVLRWEFGNRIQEAPALFHSFWKSREGRYAAVLVNWTDESRTVTLYDRRLSEEKRTITVPARDCVLTEAEITGM